MIATGLRHVVDFQDSAYGHLYLDRLAELLTLDRARGGDSRGFALTREAAKYLARAMAYDDVIDPRELRNALLRGLELSEGRFAKAPQPGSVAGIRP